MMSYLQERMRKALCIAVPLVIGLGLVGCDAFDSYGAKDDPIPPDQTEILAVIVRPDTVAAGDTVTLKVVIRDSLDTSFQFEWTLPDLIPVDGVTNGPVVKWIPPPTSEPGTIGLVTSSVTADYGDPEARPAYKVFHIPVRY